MQGDQQLTIRPRKRASVFAPVFDAFSISERDLYGAYHIRVSLTGNALNVNTKQQLTTAPNHEQEEDAVLFETVDAETMERAKQFDSGAWVRHPSMRNAMVLDDDYELVERGLLHRDSSPMYRLPNAPEAIFHAAVEQAYSMPECVAFAMHMEEGVEWYSEECYDEEDKLREGEEGWTMYIERQSVHVPDTGVRAPRVIWAPPRVDTSRDPARAPVLAGRAAVGRRVTPAASRHAWSQALRDHRAASVGK